MIPAGRVNATGRLIVSCWLTSSSRLPNGSSNAMNSRTRRDRAAAGSPRRDPEPGALQLGLGRGERVRVGDGEAGGDDAGGPLDQGQAVVPVVGAQVRHPGLGRRGQFQADDAGRELDGRREVGDAGPDVGDVGEGDHGQLRRRPG